MKNTLSIKAKILPKFADEIKQMLDLGVNLGLSIGGYVTDYTPNNDDGWIIRGFDLMEISLTGMLVNWGYIQPQ